MTLIARRLQAQRTAARTRANRDTGKLSRERKKYAKDPVKFAREKLGLKIWKRQEEILRAVAAKPRVAVKSGHKVGKSTSAAILALWFVYVHRGARVIMTSSTDRQVRIILWREVRRLYKRIAGELGGDMHVSPDPGLQLSDGGEIVGFSTKDPEKMAGISGHAVLFIVDEASGVPEAIFDAIEGNRAGGAKIVMFSNPTQTAGYFYDAFTERRASWSGKRGQLLTVSSLEAVKANIPGLATKAWIDDVVEERGIDSPFIAVRVLGLFPAQSENAVIGLGLVEKALARYDDTGATGLLSIGVDVARFGDDESVIQPVRGWKSLPATVRRGLDGKQLAGEVMKVVRTLRHARAEIPKVKIDVVGVGASAADFLREFDGDEIELIEVSAGESAPVEHYVRVRDQLWFGIAEWLKAGGALHSDAKLETELVAPTYKFDVRARMQVESKDDIKKKIKRSPDRADALALALYAEGGVSDLADFDLFNRMMPKARMTPTTSTQASLWDELDD